MMHETPRATLPAHHAKYRVLVVEDKNEGRWIKQILEREGFVAQWNTTGKDVLAVAHCWQPDIVVLDLQLADMLPQLGGISVCLELRQSFPTMPIIVLTHFQADHVHMQAIQAGADNYLTKPFDAQMLLTYMRNAVYRVEVARAGLIGQPAQRGDGVIAIDEHLTIDTARYQVRVNGSADIHFTRTELGLLDCLAYNVGKLVTYDTLVAHCWGPAHVGSEGTRKLQVHMCNVRDKLEMACPGRRYITTHVGIGYMLSRPA
jgi:two-component system KDP operon response regulator KdpE